MYTLISASMLSYDSFLIFKALHKDDDSELNYVM